MPTLPQSHPLPLYMEVVSVCAAAASSSDSGGPGGATSVYRSCCSDCGGTRVGVGERRGWTHSLLLITDQYIDWSPLIPDQLSPPLLSPISHHSALQQPHVWAWRSQRKEHWWTDSLFFSLSHSLFFLLYSMLLLTTWSPHLWALRAASGPQEMGGLNSSTTMHHVQTLKNKKTDAFVIADNSLLSVEYYLNQSHETYMWPSCDSFCFDQ